MTANHDNSNREIELAIEGWNLYNKNLFWEINDLHIKAIKSLSRQNIDKWLTGKLKFFNNIGEINACKEFSDHEKEQIKKLYSYIKGPEFSNKLLEMAITENKVLVNSVFGKGSAICKQSTYIHVHEGRNFLRFIDENETFYIIQSFIFTGIYFPSRNVIIELLKRKAKNKSLQTHVEHHNRELVRLFDKILNFLKNENTPTLYGLLFTYNRPYHYFTDFLPIIHNFIYKSTHQLKKPDVMRELPRIISFPDGMFYSIKNLYSLPCEEQIAEKEKFNEILLENNGFVVQPSSNKRYFSNHIKSDLNDLIIKKSIESLLSEHEEKKQFKKLKDCYPILWFGICGEKRSWIEKVEGIAKIVQEVQKLYPNVGVVLDGLTSTEVQNEKKFRRENANYDTKAAKQILNRIDPAIPTFNLVGCTSKKKIAYASKIDFFLTSYSTDTMYVAHICGKHGVGHLNTIMSINRHKHPNIYKIPNSLVTDIPNDDNIQNKFYVSYSIDPEPVCSIFMKKLQDYLSKK